MGPAAQLSQGTWFKLSHFLSSGVLVHMGKLPTALGPCSQAELTQPWPSIPAEARPTRCRSALSLWNHQAGEVYSLGVAVRGARGLAEMPVHLSALSRTWGRGCTRRAQTGAWT